MPCRFGSWICCDPRGSCHAPSGSTGARRKDCCQCFRCRKAAASTCSQGSFVGSAQKYSYFTLQVLDHLTLRCNACNPPNPVEKTRVSSLPCVDHMVQVLDSLYTLAQGVKRALLSFALLSGCRLTCVPNPSFPTFPCLPYNCWESSGTLIVGRLNWLSVP